MPFLAYQLALLREHGVTDIILACSYRVDDVRQALGDGEQLGVRLRYVIETEPLGTGGGVRNAADLARGTVFVLNGDVLTDADLTAMRRLHESRRSRTTIFLMPVPDPRAYGLVELDADGRLTRFREKPTADEPITTNTINAGIYLIDAALLDRIPAGRRGLDRARVLPRADRRRDPVLRLDRRGVLAGHRQPGRLPRRPDRPAERARALAAAAAGRAARRLLDRADGAPGPRRPGGRPLAARLRRRGGRAGPGRPPGRGR